jgi:hypothetical protein
MRFILEKLLFPIIGGLILAVLSKIVLAKLDLDGGPSNTSHNAQRVPLEAAKEESSLKANSTPVEQSAATPVQPKASYAKVQENSTTESSSETTTDASDKVCRPRMVKVQDRAYSGMQRLLDPLNDDCMSVGEMEKVIFVIENCAGAIVRPKHVRIDGEYYNAFLGSSNSLEHYYSQSKGSVYEKDDDGWDTSNASVFRGAYSTIIVAGNGGNICSIDISFN